MENVLFIRSYPMEHDYTICIIIDFVREPGEKITHKNTLIDLSKALNLSAAIFDDIVPEREWSGRKIVPIDPIIRCHFIERAIDYHIFLCLRVASYTDDLIGMMISSGRLIVTPARIWEGLIVYSIV